jgi:hypothetical protein
MKNNTQSMPTRWEDALQTHNRMFVSNLPCLKGHGLVRMAYWTMAKNTRLVPNAIAYIAKARASAHCQTS